MRIFIYGQKVYYTSKSTSGRKPLCVFTVASMYETLDERCLHGSDLRAGGRRLEPTNFNERVVQVGRDGWYHFARRLEPGFGFNMNIPLNGPSHPIHLQIKHQEKCVRPILTHPTPPTKHNISHSITVLYRCQHCSGSSMQHLAQR